jgi:hypothetical protein
MSWTQRYIIIQIVMQIAKAIVVFKDPFHQIRDRIKNEWRGTETERKREVDKIEISPEHAKKPLVVWVNRDVAIGDFDVELSHLCARS